MCEQERKRRTRDGQPVRRSHQGRYYIRRLLLPRQPWGVLSRVRPRSANHYRGNRRHHHRGVSCLQMEKRS